MEISADQNGRNLRPSKGKSSSLAAHDAIEAITAALQEEYGELRSTAKRIARDADRTEKAVRNWLERKNLPDALSLLRLMQRSAAVRAAVNALVGVEPEARPRSDLEDELDRMERLLARIIEEKRGRAAAE